MHFNSNFASGSQFLRKMFVIQMKVCQFMDIYSFVIYFKYMCNRLPIILWTQIYSSKYIYNFYLDLRLWGLLDLRPNLLVSRRSGLLDLRLLPPYLSALMDLLLGPMSGLSDLLGDLLTGLTEPRFLYGDVRPDGLGDLLSGLCRLGSTYGLAFKK